MGFSKNGMLVYIPHILEAFIEKLDLDAKQERVMTKEEFYQAIAYFRLTKKEDFFKIIEDLENIGVIYKYDNGSDKIYFK